MKFAMYLTVLFIGLKLTNYIDWSWFWVLSPMPISFVVGILALAGVAALVSSNDVSKKSFSEAISEELHKLNNK